MSKDNTLKLSVERSNELRFELDVYGSSSDAPVTARFVCEAADEEHGFPCRIEGSTAIAVVPKMAGKLAPGKYKARLEVFVGDNVFVPLMTEALFCATPRVQVRGMRATLSAEDDHVELRRLVSEMLRGERSRSK